MSGGGVEITLRDLYDLLMTLTGQVQASMSQGESNRARGEDHEARLRALETTASAAKETSRVAVDHEVRIRDVERWRRALPVALLVSLASLICTAIAVFK